ncbi:MAG: hypothetical protein AAGI01_06365 [Myxococcota bacterium]
MCFRNRQTVGVFCSQKHSGRTGYAELEERWLSTSSGAVGSMIRQVVDMRLKGYGKLCKREHAERMLSVVRS